MAHTTKTPIEIVQQVAHLTGATLYPDYSGRGMFGQKCVGLVTPTPEDVVKVSQAAKRRGLSGHLCDDMGLGAIVYWPHIQMEVSANVEATNRLKDYLRGYGRGQVNSLNQLADLSDWGAVATQVLQARQYSLLSALDDELLGFIQSGEVHVQEAALAVARERQSGADGEGGHD